MFLTWSNYKSFFQGTENKFLTRLAYHAGFRWTSAFLIYVHLSRTSSWNGLIFLPPFSHSIAQKLSTTIAILETFDQLWVDIKEWWSYFDCANPREKRCWPKIWTSALNVIAPSFFIDPNNSILETWGDTEVWKVEAADKPTNSRTLSDSAADTWLNFWRDDSSTVLPGRHFEGVSSVRGWAWAYNGRKRSRTNAYGWS